jgi:hypothetical protein
VSAKWAASFARWAPHYAPTGEIYSLTHMHPHRFMLEFEPRLGYPAQTVEIRVGYSSHPFTIQCPDGTPVHAQYSRPHDPRVFSEERYEWSLQLPDILKGIGARRCFATNRKNYFVVDDFEGLPPNTEYWVFFNARRDGDALRIFVESAYAGDVRKAPYARKHESTLFRALASKTLGLKKSNPAV